MTAQAAFPITVPVLAAHTWPSNGHLIADLVGVHQLDSYTKWIDPTYGRGTWWTIWQPDNLATHDLAEDGVDFRQLPYPDSTFDAAAFDPPYVSRGGRTTAGAALTDTNDRYGLVDAPRTPAGVQQLINDGLTELHRVVKHRGLVLVKCQDYITSGGFWPGAILTVNHALSAGFRLVDRAVFVQQSVRPQPHDSQKHLRRNVSDLLILRRDR